jgi:uncharacterized protein
MDDLIHGRHGEILGVFARYGASNPRLFGSFARGDAGPASDVDFLVDMESTRTLLDLVGLQQDLEEMLGRRVDVVTEGGLSPYLREQILSQAISL